MLSPRHGPFHTQPELLTGMEQRACGLKPLLNVTPPLTRQGLLSGGREARVGAMFLSNRLDRYTFFIIPPGWSW